MWITFATIFLIPKFQKLLHDGLIDGAALREQSVGWMASFLSRVSDIGGHYSTWLLLLAICLGGIFEWRVRTGRIGSPRRLACAKVQSAASEALRPA